MSTDQGPFAMETTYTLDETPTGGTHMTLPESTSRDLQLRIAILEKHSPQ